MHDHVKQFQESICINHVRRFNNSIYIDHVTQFNKSKFINHVRQFSNSNWTVWQKFGNFWQNWKLNICFMNFLFGMKIFILVANKQFSFIEILNISMPHSWP